MGLARVSARSPQAAPMSDSCTVWRMEGLLSSTVVSCCINLDSRAEVCLSKEKLSQESSPSADPFFVGWPCQDCVASLSIQDATPRVEHFRASDNSYALGYQSDSASSNHYRHIPFDDLAHVYPQVSTYTTGPPYNAIAQCVASFHEGSSPKVPAGRQWLQGFRLHGWFAIATEDGGPSVLRTTQPKTL